MSSLALTALLQISLLATGADSYEHAYNVTQETGKPLVVLVGTDWCPGCQAMRNSVMPEVAAHGELNNVSFAHVNSDREGELASKLMSGNLIPQLVKYTKTENGWKIDRLVGTQSPETVEEFLRPAAVPTQTVASVQAQ